MALFTNLQSLSQTAGANPPDGSADAPSTIPADLRLLGSFDAIMRDGGHQWGSTVTGTNTIAITVNGVSSLVPGQTFKFVAAGANTAAVTLNVNSLGAKNVYKFGATPLAAGDIASLSTVCVVWDGTNMQLVGVAQSSSLAPNGWAKFSNGLIVQWGLATTSSGGGVAVTLPTAYPTAQLSAVASANTNGVNPTVMTVNALTTTQLTLYSSYGPSGAGVPITAYWISLGY